MQALVLNARDRGVRQNCRNSPLDAGVQPGACAVGSRLTVIYENHEPFRARWAGRSWRNEPPAALARARRGFHWFAAVAACLVGFLMPVEGRAQLLGPTPYLSSNDSPFVGITFSYFHLENMESGAIMVPGVTPSAGGVINPSFFTDSVDADDGAIDGFGRLGHSFFSNDGPVGIRFTFTASALGGDLPTHVGIVWTDGTNAIRFEAFDAANNSLGVVTGNHADGSFGGQTGEDRFYGIISSGGVSSILIQNGGGGIEVDHLQYGFAVVPEPAAFALSGVAVSGLAACLWRRRRRRRRKVAAGRKSSPDRR